MTDIQKAEIYNNYHDRIYGYILSRINHPQDADDLTADVFVKKKRLLPW